MEVLDSVVFLRNLSDLCLLFGRDCEQKLLSFGELTGFLAQALYEGVAPVELLGCIAHVPGGGGELGAEVAQLARGAGRTDEKECHQG